MPPGYARDGRRVQPDSRVGGGGPTVRRWLLMFATGCRYRGVLSAPFILVGVAEGRGSMNEFDRRAALKAMLAAQAVMLSTMPAPTLAAARPGENLSAILARRPASGRVVVPADAAPLTIGGTVRVPPGTTLIIRRDIVGGPDARLLIGDDTTVLFEGAASRNVGLIVSGSRIRISGFRFSGLFPQAAIEIPSSGHYRDVLIENFVIEDANYGILRQGATSSIRNVVVRRGRFARLRGDAIEWNIVPNDQGLIIDDHVIDGIDDPVGRPAWGIGIGVAGARYDAGWNRTSMARGFRITNIRGSHLRQLVHVEAGADFLVRGIRGVDISSRYSAKSDMPTALVACYGCDNFVIRDVSGVGDILIFAGVAQGQYIVPSRNFTLADIRIARGSIATEMGGATSFARLLRIGLSSGGVLFRGEVATLTLADLDIRNPKGPALLSKPDFLSGTLAPFRPARSVVHRSRLMLSGV